MSLPKEPIVHEKCQCRGLTPLEEAQIIKERNAAERARILRKIDLHLLPIVTLFYLLSFLDRVNIGNARIAGMSTDLHLNAFKYNVVAGVFFITYSLAEVPSNILLKLFKPSRWIPFIMLAWGLVMTLMCLVDSYNDLIIARLFLGLTEAGLFPGINAYLCYWYPQSERSKRIAIFFSAATIAGAFGGFLAYAIEHMDGMGGLRAWRWIFCLEGLTTVVVASVSFYFMHDYPETAMFLTEPERAYIMDMLKQDASNTVTGYSIHSVLQVMKDYKIYIQVLIYMGILVPGYSVALFLPSIIVELGYSSTNAQLLTIPPFFSGCFFTLVAGIYSDKHGVRGPYITGGTFVALVGYVLLYFSTRSGTSYVGAMLTVTGIFPCIPVLMAWVGSNAGSDLKRGIALASVIGFGSLGGICSSFIYVDPPRFHIGYSVSIAFICIAITTTLFSMWNFNRLNRSKEVQCQEEGILKEKNDEFAEMGDDSPLFRYTI